MSKRKDPAEQVIRSAEEEAADDPLLTLAEVGRLFRVSHSTIWRWVTEGKIDSIKLPGGLRKVRLSMVKEILGEVADQIADA